MRISRALNFLRGPRFLDEDTAPEMSRDEKSTFSKIIGAHWKERTFGTRAQQINDLVVLYVAVSYIIHALVPYNINTLFQQVNAHSGYIQLPILCCTNVHLRNTCPLFRRTITDDIMSKSELTTVVIAI